MSAVLLTPGTEAHLAPADCACDHSPMMSRVVAAVDRGTPEIKTDSAAAPSTHIPAPARKGTDRRPTKIKGGWLKLYSTAVPENDIQCE